MKRSNKIGNTIFDDFFRYLQNGDITCNEFLKLDKLVNLIKEKT